MEASVPIPPEPADEAAVPGNHNAILSELRKLNSPQRNWTKALVVFAISLALFAMMGWAQYNDPVFLGMLVGVLFFHELGHFVAMRLFGYRNVRMFFIPLFGAAVSGRCFQLAGWKKAMVSLMGPLPGIIVGTALFAMPLWGYPSQWAVRLGCLMIFLNLFNLLPLQPFDGGRYLNTILFCRNRWFEAAIRLITSLLLGLLAWKLRSVALGVVTYLMFISTTVSFRCATIASCLRAHLPPPDPGSNEIPQQAVNMIVNEIRASLPQLKTDAQIAATVQSIYEEATTRAPSWLASLGLLVLYPLVFLCPVAPWVVAGWHHPALVQEWRAKISRSRAAQREQITTQPNAGTDTATIERQLPALGPLKSAKWTRQQMTLDTPLKRLAFRLQGYAQLGDEKIAEFSSYPWQPAGPEFQPTSRVPGNLPRKADWCWCQPFTKNNIPQGTTGELYFDRHNGLVYFDIQIQ